MASGPTQLEGGNAMHLSPLRRRWAWLGALGGCALLFALVHPFLTPSDAGDPKPKKADIGKTSYDQISPVIIGQETFAAMVAKDKANKPAVIARQKALLEERYDLARKVHDSLKMTRGKPIPVGPTARLSMGMTFEKLAS